MNSFQKGKGLPFKTAPVRVPRSGSRQDKETLKAEIAGKEQGRLTLYELLERIAHNEE